jgi:hypothetical protein
MSQVERDRLMILKQARKKQITQKQAAEQMEVTERQVRRLLRRLRQVGDRAVIHTLRGQPSNRKMNEATEQEAIQILTDPIYTGFGPTLASEYLLKRHSLKVSRETLRKWMSEAGLWKARKRRVEEIHVWRERRSCLGEMLQWDTSEHDWLEGRGEKMYLISMIDDATSRLWARFVRHDSTAENMQVLRVYLERYGRPRSVYTDKASLFQVAVKTKRGEQRLDKDQREMPPTQIGRALQELGIVWIAAHSPQAKGRVERQFQTDQDRLVKGLRVAGACTLEEANAYLDSEYLPWWNQTLTVVPASPANAHRPLGKEHDLAAILSHVQSREVDNGYAIRFDNQRYQIDRTDVRVGLRGAKVRVELRLDGSVAVCFKGHYLRVQVVPEAEKAAPAIQRRTLPPKPRKSTWMSTFFLKRAPNLKQAIAISNAHS